MAVVSSRAGFVADHTRHVVLRDGTPVVLRPAVPEDKALLAAAFERLSPESRYRRFFSPMPTLSPSLLRYLTEIDYVDHFAWAALAEEAGEWVGVGVSRFIRLADRAVAEAAFTVIDPYQGRGLGTVLFDALVLEATSQGITRFEGTVLAENASMQGVLRRAGARFVAQGGGVLRFGIELPTGAEALRPSPLADAFRAVARGEAELYQDEPCPWLTDRAPSALER